METGVSMPHTQVLSNNFYPELNQPNFCIDNYLFNNPYPEPNQPNSRIDTYLFQGLF